MKLKNKTLLYHQSILSQNGISCPQFKNELFNLFHSSSKSLSVNDIVNYFDNSINKVTVYRSLDSFENKGLIHKVPDANNLKRYSLCRENECHVNSHNHKHFICYYCN